MTLASRIAGIVASLAATLGSARADDEFEWRDVRTLAFEGQAWTDVKAPFDRLPARAEGKVRPPVWNLSRDSAGLAARFVTDSTQIRARWTLAKKALAMPHMAATGVSGLDLYGRDDKGGWRWVGVGQPTDPTNEKDLANGLDGRTREYMIYLPLYNGVSKVEIGVPKGKTLRPADSRPEDRRKPIVFYGTSITHGGCASRPGAAHVAIVGRRFDRPVINLGFSGNGTMDDSITDLLVEIDAAAYVIDCLPNMTADQVTARTAPLVRTIRARRPGVPIVLAEDRNYTDGTFIATRRLRNESNHEALRAAFDKLKAEGVPGLSYLEGSAQLGDDDEATVDGSHPTDLGFRRMADAFETVLTPLVTPPPAPR